MKAAQVTEEYDIRQRFLVHGRVDKGVE